MALILKSLKTYNSQSFDLTVQAGECICISGASGAGKTLLLRAIADLDPHEGQVLLDNEESQSLPPHVWRKKVGLLPSESQWWFDSVGEHFVNHNPELLIKIGFANDVLGWQVKRLSTGEKQRLAILRMLCMAPKALLLDEPTANLDEKNTKIVESILHDYCKKNAAPVLWISHTLEQIRRVGDRWFQVENGKFEEQKIK